MSIVYLGIDIGTTSAKCLAVDETGAVLAQAQQPYVLQHPHQGWAEQSPEDYLQALVTIVRECVRRCRAQGIAPGDIAAMSMSTQGDTLIVTDGRGRALAKAISWMDSRAQEEYQALLAQADQAFWYRQTGQRLTPYGSACKIRWLAEQQSDLWARVSRVCAVPDYLAACLCGRFATDIPSASWSACFKPHDRAWSVPVMELLGIVPEQLPQVVESGAAIGPLLPEAATQLGLTPDTMLMAGAFDQGAAALGAGARAGGHGVLSCGTAWVLYAVTVHPYSDSQTMLPLCCHTGSSEWGLLAPFTGGAAYDWFRHVFKEDSDSPTSGRAESLYFLPYLYGVGVPDWRAEVCGTLLGLTMAHNRADIEQAVMCGIGCETRRCLEIIETLSGPLPGLRMVGGATKSTVWPQIIADLLGRPVQVSVSSEAAAYGAAKLAAGPHSAGWPEMPHTVVEPVPEGVKDMNVYYARYQRCRAGILPLYS